MSIRLLTVLIEGQEALPVRALPYVTTSARFRPEVLARRFAGTDPFGRTWNLRAHHYRGEDASYTVLPKEWEEVAKRLDRFAAGLKEQFPTGTAGYTLWRNGAVALLPPCWFVTLDEFEKAFHTDEGRMFDRKRPADHELILSPEVDAKTRGMLMEGFENCAGIEAAASFPRVPRFNFIAQTQITNIHSLQKIGAKRITKDRAFLIDCEREGIPMNIESIWLHIGKNAGKENFLFKSYNNKTATTVDDKPVKKENLARVLLDLLKYREIE